MMKRRYFLKKTTFSLPALVVPAILASCNKDSEEQIVTDKKVLIIGAGVAGLGAAKYLKGKGIDVVVVEAQNKVGGRLKTDRSLGVSFDEGASWIHGPTRNPITAIAEASGARTFVDDEDNLALFDIDGSTYSDDELDNTENEYERILSSLDGEVNLSFQDAFYLQYPQYRDNRLWTYLLSAYLEFDTGSDISELSSLDYDDDELFRGDDLIITNGYDLIAKYLAQDIDIKLDTKVIGIDYSNTLIQVRTNQEIFEVDYVLLTVPLGVLREGIISFTPSLPSGIEQAISRLKMGSVNKFLCTWDVPFWDTDLQYIGYTSEVKGKFNYFLNMKKFTDANALMTFCYGDYSKQTENMSEAEIIDEIMSHLKTIYGDEIPPPSNLLRTKWTSNEYTFGAYSFISNGTRSSDFEAFEQQVEDKLFFAGEHTSRDYRGTVHGAYLSGIREAEKIVDLL
ncbi:MAG: flavin monoamine oxidase family protein [Lewinella sp.]